MAATLVIAGNEIRQRLRDRSAIVLGLIAPLVIAGLMSLAFHASNTFHFSLAVVDRDHGAMSAALIAELRSPSIRPIVTTVTMDDEAEASTAVRAKTVAAALVIPAGFSAAALGGPPVPLTTVTSVNNPIAGSVTSAIAASFVAQLNADRLSVATALAAGAPASRADALDRLVAGAQLPVQTVARPVGARELAAISYYSPGMAIFFLLFAIGFASRSFFVDRSTGMIERMRAAPVRPFEILAGKALAVFVYGITSLALIAVITSVAFGADWGNPVAAGLLCVAMVIAVVTISAFVMSVARTQRQAEGISSLVVFGLALLGGNFLFISSAPPLMRRLALLTPNGWAMRAFTDLATLGGGPRSVLAPVGAILAFSAVVGLAAAALSRRALTA